MLPLGLMLWGLSENDGLDIAVSTGMRPLAILRANIVDGSPDAREKELSIDETGVPEVSGLSDDTEVAVVELVADDEAVAGFEEKGEKTVPSTRFAFSLEASFLSCARNLECFLGSGVVD